MPVTAKLSRKFYEQFGDDLTNELVNWMNQVDAGYRTEFRELFDVNFARFEARLQQGLGELRADLRGELHDDIGSLKQALTTQRSELLQAMAELKGELRTEIAASRAETMRWNVILWIGTVGTMIALVKLG